MKIYVRRIRKGERYSARLDGGYVSTLATEAGYCLLFGKEAIYVTDSHLKAARGFRKGEGVLVYD